MDALETFEFTERLPCGTCGEPFESRGVRFNGRTFAQQLHCAPCRDKREADQKAAELDALFSAREQAWAEICPSIYRQTDLDRLRTERTLNPALVDRITSWPKKGNGLGIIGRSGRGKTRLMFLALRRQFMAGRSVMYVNATVMSDELAARYSESARAADDWVRRMCLAPALFVDDFGKGKLTERAEVALYRVIETRHAEARQLYFTANCTGEDLMRRISEDRGEPIVRRLREMCEIVTL